MPYRAELKRPDLKGTFRCSICFKIFCHSSSLSRHRMQAHFKSYTCTICRKEITSNETLRAHMYKQHQISRMFMCRCCNWAFPDKTSLHLHMQSTGGVKSKVITTGAPTNAASTIPAHAQQQTTASFPFGDPSKPNISNGMPPSLPLFAPPPNGIFPLLAGREDLMQRFRDHMPFNAGAVPDAAAALNLAALFSNFPRVDASGVGSLGGSIILQPDEDMIDNGNTQPPVAANGDTTPPPTHDDTMATDGDDDSGHQILISVDDEQHASPDSGTARPRSDNCLPTQVGQNVAVSYHPSRSVGCKQELNDICVDETKEGEVTSSRSPETSEAASQSTLNDIAVKRAQLLANLINASRFQFGGFPVVPMGNDSPLLRSAINSTSSSPLNSLLYRKKLESAMKRNAIHNFLNENQNVFGFDGLPTPPGSICSPLTSAPMTLPPPSSMANSLFVSQAINGGRPSGVGAPSEMIGGGRAGGQGNGSDVSPAESHSSSIGHGSPPSGADSGAAACCFECQLVKGKLSMTENRARFLEAKIHSMTNETTRLEQLVKSLESTISNLETESRQLRSRNELLQNKLLECQEKALMFMQNADTDSARPLQLFFTDILRITSLGAP